MLVGGARVVLLASLLTLLAGPNALAALRFASPSGNPAAACSRGDPCDFGTAVDGAANGDEVIVLRGTYAIGPAPVIDNAAITIHGAANAPRPVLHSSVVGQPALAIRNAGSQVRFLELGASNGTALALGGGLAEEIVARSGNTAEGACTIGAASLRDSICASSGVGAAGLLSDDTGGATASLRNVTAIGSGPGGIGVYARATGSGADVQLSLTNVIARGQGNDIGAQAGASDSASVSVSHSNYAHASAAPPATITDDGTQQTAPPVFLNQAAGDYHQASSSPTVDHGITSPDNGAYDVDGDARLVGSATDIGADELDLPATVSTEPAVPVRPGGATLRAHVNPNGPPTHVTFQYGTTRRYGQTADGGDLGPVGFPIEVTAALGGLNPGTVYHYRVVAVSPEGTERGKDIAFSTPPLLLTGLRQSRSEWRETSSKTASSAFGTTFSFVLNDRATVVFTFQRQVAGHMRHGTCRAHARRGSHCVLRVVAGSMRVHGHAGVNTLAFKGVINHGTVLRPGSYIVTVVAHANGAATRPRHIAFTIVR